MAGTGKASAKVKIDWEAVERDYRVTNLTLRELGDRHGCDHAAIARKAKKLNWKRDLTGAVRRATSQLMIEAAVDEAVTNRQQAVTSDVLVVAARNAAIGVRHQKRLGALQDIADRAAEKLAQMIDEVADVRDVAAIAAAVNATANAAKTLIDQERKAYGMDAEEDKTTDSVESLLIEAMNGKTDS